jgi:hypothetical protein
MLLTIVAYEITVRRLARSQFVPAKNMLWRKHSASLKPKN